MNPRSILSCNSQKPSQLSTWLSCSKFDFILLNSVPTQTWVTRPSWMIIPVSIGSRQLEDKLGQEHNWLVLTRLVFHLCFETRRSWLICMTGPQTVPVRRKRATSDVTGAIPTQKVSTGVSISFTPTLCVTQESYITKRLNFVNT